MDEDKAYLTPEGPNQKEREKIGGRWTLAGYYRGNKYTCVWTPMPLGNCPRDNYTIYHSRPGQCGPDACRCEEYPLKATSSKP